MKIIQLKDSVIVDILNAKDDITLENIMIVNDIPQYEPKEGYSGELRYSSENELYWEYIKNPPEEEQEVSPEELAEMIDEVM